MRRSLVLVCFGLVFLLSQAATNALGQPPDFLRNYRFLPRHSTLHVTGGFAGFDIEANIFGRYGLVTGFDYGGPSIDPIVPSLHPFAKFVDVDAVAITKTHQRPPDVSTLEQKKRLTRAIVPQRAGYGLAMLDSECQGGH